MNQQPYSIIGCTWNIERSSGVHHNEALHIKKAALTGQEIATFWWNIWLWAASEQGECIQDIEYPWVPGVWVVNSSHLVVDISEAVLSQSLWQSLSMEQLSLPGSHLPRLLKTKLYRLEARNPWWTYYEHEVHNFMQATQQQIVQSI